TEPRRCNRYTPRPMGRRPFASRGYMRRRPRQGGGGSPFGALALLAVVGLSVLAVNWMWQPFAARPTALPGTAIPFALGTPAPGSAADPAAQELPTEAPEPTARATPDATQV